MQRVFLFLLTNIAIMIILSLTLRILGVVLWIGTSWLRFRSSLPAPVAASVFLDDGLYLLVHGVHGDYLRVYPWVLSFVAVSSRFLRLFGIIAGICLLTLVTEYLGLCGYLVEPLKLLLHLIELLSDFCLLITLFLHIFFEFIVLVDFLNLVLDFLLEYIILFHSLFQF